MGHATHFLQRIERLTTLQADFALTLYRAPELLKELLHKQPENVERVAIAVEHHANGPHILVTRGGSFITCLGPGMHVGDIPVIPRAEIDRQLAEYAEMEQILTRLKERGSLLSLTERLLNAGAMLDREDFAALRVLEPLLRNWLLATVVDLAEVLMEFRMTYRRHRFRSLTAENQEKLLTFWRYSWALGHIITVCGHQVRAQLDTYAVGEQSEAVHKLWRHLSWAATRTMSTPIVLRGAWYAARAGKHLFDLYQDALEHAPTWMQFFDACLAVTATGLRHRRLRAQALKSLQRRTAPIFHKDIHDFYADSAAEIAQMCADLLGVDKYAELMQRMHRMLGAKIVLRYGEKIIPADHPLHYTEEDAVPHDLAYVILMRRDTALYDEYAQVRDVVTMLPWVASVDAEELYLPSEVSQTYIWPCNPQLMMQQLDGFQRHNGHNVPAAAEKKPGRNELCSCGSGKKYKRCCADKPPERNPVWEAAEERSRAMAEELNPSPEPRKARWAKRRPGSRR